MERCVFCQAPCPPGSVFCPHCGQQQPTTDYIPLEGIPPDGSALTEEGSVWNDQTLAAPPESVAAQQASPAFVYHEFPINPQQAAYPLASGPTWAATPPGAGQTAPFPAARPAPAPRPPRNYRKALAIVLVVLIVLGAGGAAAYIFTRPAPVISVTGQQQAGSLPAGSPDLSFHVSGRDFTANSSVNFFLDGKAAPGAPKITSDQHGSFQTNLLITDDWLLGQHTLTARDAKGYITKSGARLAILAAPVLSVTSQYLEGSTPAGSQGTTLSYSGKRFALNSAITLLLDGKPLQSASPITSDARGRFTGSISVNTQLAQGNYTLTAQDAQGNVTKTAATFEIVAQGEASTPGPKGAPADDASFGVAVNVTARSADQSFSFQQTLVVTGNPDPAGGTVCSYYDNGQPQTYTGTFIGSSETYTETITFSCKGTYKHGQLTYIETATSDVLVEENGVRCSTSGSYVYENFVGSFTNATTLRGTYSTPYHQANCTNGSYIFWDSATGTWTGNI